MNVTVKKTNKSVAKLGDLTAGVFFENKKGNLCLTGMMVHQVRTYYCFKTECWSDLGQDEVVTVVQPLGVEFTLA